MMIYHKTTMLKRIYTTRQMIHEYVTSGSDMEKEAFGLVLKNYPFNK